MKIPMLVGNLTIFDSLKFATRSRQLDLLARGDYSPIQSELDATFPNSSLPVRAIPFVQRYVAELAGLYARPVVRRFRPGDLGLAAFTKLQTVYGESKIDRAMDRIEQALWVQNTVMAVVMPDGLGKVRLQPILPWQVEAVEVTDAMAASNPRSWSRVVAQMPASVTADQVIMGRLELTHTHAWRATAAGKVGIYAEDGTHPFGRVPIIIAHRVAPDDGRWAAPINEAVLNLQMSLSLQSADNENIVRNCAWPQKVIKNATIAQQVDEVTVGPDKVIALVRSGNPDDPAPELAVVQGQVPVSELVSFAEHQIRLYCAMLGLDPSAFLRVNTAVTAAARLFSAQDRAAIRHRLQPVLRQFENDLARWIVAVLALREPMPLPTDLGVDVTWSIPAPQSDPQSDAQATTAGIAIGTEAPSLVVANRDGISRKAALALVESNLAEARALGLIAPASVQLATADPDTATDPAAAAARAADPAADVAKEALNGAQVASMLAVITAVSDKSMAANSGKALLRIAFPTASDAAIDSMIAAASTHTPPAAEPTVEQPDG